MIHLVYGDDTKKRQDGVETLVSLYKKQGFSFQRFEDTNFDETSFLNTLSSDGLFGGRVGALVFHGLSKEETRDFFEQQKSLLEKSQSPIIFVETNFLKKDFPSFKKLFSSVLECKSLVKKEVPVFNTFSFVDAIVSGDKKKSWLLLQEAIASNQNPEELIAPLFWQYKIIALVMNGQSGEVLGLKPFVFSKAKKTSLRFSKKEIQEKLFSLIVLFRDIRNSGEGFLHLEKFILSL